MLTDTQIDAGEARLDSGTKKLKDDDVVKMVAVFRMFLGSLETTYGYQFETKLRELDDTDTSTGRKASQVAACIIEMEALGFGVAELVSGNGVNYKEKSDYKQYVVIAFAQLYPLPEELSMWDLKRRTSGARSGTVMSRRYERRFC